MRVDGGLGSGSGREPEDLRAILRQWKVPGAPPEIEDDLRRTFRRRRDRRLPIFWLAVAASVVLLLVYHLAPRGRPSAPVVAESAPSATPAAPTLPPPPVAVRPLEARAREIGALARARQAPREEDVVVEPGQAALLAQLARELRGKRVAPPAAAAPQIVAAPLEARPRPILEAPPRDTFLSHRTEWKRIETEWPFVHRSL